MRIKPCYLQDPAALTAAWDAAFRDLRLPGATAAALHNGEIFCTHAFGVKDTQKNPVTPETLFESASLTKSLFGTLVLRLVDKGFLNLDRPIVEIYPHEPWSLDPRYAAITPRHCLSHTSGLPNWQAKPMEMLFDPGSRFSYSGEGYFLLQRTVEYLTGKDLNHLLHEHFLIPLGMTVSSATWTPAIGQSFAQGFGRDGSVAKVRDARRVSGNAPEPNAAWSLCSNAFDMARFQRYILQHRAGLSSGAFGEMSRAQVRPAPGVGWGLGWGLAESEPGLLWHWGDNTGFQSLSVLDWTTGDALCFYANSDNAFAHWWSVVAQVTDLTCGEELEDFIRHAES